MGSNYTGVANLQGSKKTKSDEQIKDSKEFKTERKGETGRAKSKDEFQKRH